jgi:hypothetical protein
LPTEKYPEKFSPKVPIKPEILVAITGTPQASASDKTFELPSIFDVMQARWLPANTSRVFRCDKWPIQR